jgi:hypothetical protein
MTQSIRRGLILNKHQRGKSHDTVSLNALSCRPTQNLSPVVSGVVTVLDPSPSPVKLKATEEMPSSKCVCRILRKLQIGGPTVIHWPRGQISTHQHLITSNMVSSISYTNDLKTHLREISNLGFNLHLKNPPTTINHTVNLLRILSHLCRGIKIVRSFYVFIVYPE